VSKRAVVDASIASADQLQIRFAQAELHRVMGELLLMQPA
jgi:hypothetical protein